MAARNPLIAGNWKMHTTVPEAEALARAVRRAVARVRGVEVVLCPPFVSLAAVARAVRGSALKVGAQNVHYEAKGAFTGEVAPPMLAGLCQYVIVGHSERRRLFGESDSVVGRKVRAVLTAGLRPVLCVGEELEQRKSGRTVEVVRQQVRAALEGPPQPEGLVVAYEPVWAIGSGLTPTGREAATVAGLVRETLAQLYGVPFAQSVRVLYGGSATAGNIEEFVREEEIDGALVGGASLKAEEFAQMVRITAAARAALPSKPVAAR